MFACIPHSDCIPSLRRYELTPVSSCNKGVVGSHTLDEVGGNIEDSAVIFGNSLSLKSSDSLRVALIHCCSDAPKLLSSLSIAWKMSLYGLSSWLEKGRGHTFTSARWEHWWCRPVISGSEQEPQGFSKNVKVPRRPAKSEPSQFEN
jgi:hypothetical protein